jgi:hypothetical protein
MGYKPEDFFISFSDFFTIIMPGAILAFTLKDSDIVSVFDGKIFPVIEPGTQNWIAFFVASYVVGHIISISGGFLDGIYGLALERIVIRHFPALVTNYVQLESRAKCLMPDKRIPFSRGYAHAYVRLHNTEAAIEIDRQQAISRFFRSFAVVLFILTLSLSVRRLRGAHFISDPLLLMCLVLLMFSLFLYSYQRWKRTRLTYTYFIALNENQNAPGVEPLGGA